MTISRCRSCNAAIIWAKTESGKTMPLDAEPAGRPSGVFRIEYRNGYAHAISVAGEPVYVSHFATCPNAAQHRRSAA
jgi:hypothetical protein